MKKYLLFALLVAALPAFSQQSLPSLEANATDDISIDSLYRSLRIADGQYAYTGIIQVDSSRIKNVLYRRARLFLADSRLAVFFPQYEEREEGRVIGRGSFAIGDTRSLLAANITWTVSFSMELICKDGKYRYSIDKFIIEARSDIPGKENFPITYSTMNLDEAYVTMHLGGQKKIERRLFVFMNERVRGIIADLRAGMSASPTPSSADF
jgi:Domain of unknown function (DUF4468) with TBP-like fold